MDTKHNPRNVEKLSNDYLKGYADGVSDGSTGLVNVKKFEKGEELNEREG